MSSTPHHHPRVRHHRDSSKIGSHAHPLRSNPISTPLKAPARPLDSPLYHKTTRPVKPPQTYRQAQAEGTAMQAALIKKQIKHKTKATTETLVKKTKGYCEGAPGKAKDVVEQTARFMHELPERTTNTWEACREGCEPHYQSAKKEYERIERIVKAMCDSAATRAGGLAAGFEQGLVSGCQAYRDNVDEARRAKRLSQRG